MRQLGDNFLLNKLLVTLWQVITLQSFEFMSLSAFEKLKKTAEKYDESPLDFYDHLIVARKNSTISPIYRRCMEKGEPYDRSEDPYANACDYYKECAYSDNRDVEEILDLSRNDIVEKLNKSASGASEIFFQEIAKGLNTQLDSSQSKRVPVNALFLEGFLKKKGMDLDEIEKIVVLVRSNLSTILRENILDTQRDRVKEFISDNAGNIIKMRSVQNKRQRTIRINEQLWNKIEIFRPSNANDLSTHDLARGIYLLILNSILSLKGK